MQGGDSGAEQDAAAARAALRAFVRTHHPDVGGDPEVFAEGLAELRATRDRRCTAADPPAGAGDRYDAPIVVVTRARGLPGLVRRLRAWHARRKRPPRVR